MIKPRFTPDIQLGHILQAIVFVFTVGGSVLGAYLSLNAAISQQSTRIAIVEQIQAAGKADDAGWRSEMRQSMQTFNAAVTELSRSFNTTVAQLSREIADLRVSIAQAKVDRK